MAGLVLPAVAQARTSASRDDRPETHQNGRLHAGRGFTRGRRMASGDCADQTHGQAALIPLDRERLAEPAWMASARPRALSCDRTHS